MSQSDSKFNYKDGVTLKEYFGQRLDDLEEKINVRFDLQRTALEKQERTLDARLAGMNEFRNAMKDQTAQFVTREEVNLRLEAKDKGRRDNIALFISLVAFAMSMLLSVLQLLGK